MERTPAKIILKKCGLGGGGFVEKSQIFVPESY